jgi:hypothetical protein
MIIHREIVSSYHSKTMSRGWTTPPSWWTARRRPGWRRRDGRRPFWQRYPSNLCRFSLCFAVFMFLHRRHWRTPREGPYIVVSRSSLSIWDQDRQNRMVEVPMSMGGPTWSGAHHLDSFGPCRPPPVFLLLILFLRENTNARKNIV